MTEFITRSCHAENRYEVIIKTDSEEHYKSAQAFARLLVGHAKPATNGDRIRAINDEELAQIFSDMACKFMCGYCEEYERIKTATVDVRCNGECDKAYLRWLKQPAEEVDE